MSELERLPLSAKLIRPNICSSRVGWQGRLPALFLQPRRPVDYHSHRRAGRLLGLSWDEKPAVLAYVVPRTDACDARVKKRFRRACFKPGPPLHIDRHHFSIRADE